MVLDEERAHLLANSMRIAADRYAEDAKVCDPVHVGMAQQFRRQETEAREICKLLADLGYC